MSVLRVCRNTLYVIVSSMSSIFDFLASKMERRNVKISGKQVMSKDQVYESCQRIRCRNHVKGSSREVMSKDHVEKSCQRIR